MVGIWENDRRGIILEHFGLPKKPADVRVRKLWGLWMQQQTRTYAFVLLAAEVGLCHSSPLRSPELFRPRESSRMRGLLALAP